MTDVKEEEEEDKAEEGEKGDDEAEAWNWFSVNELIFTHWDFTAGYMRVHCNAGQ